MSIAQLQWDIHNVTHNKDLKRFSEPFMIGGYPWYVQINFELKMQLFNTACMCFLSV